MPSQSWHLIFAPAPFWDTRVSSLLDASKSMSSAKSNPYTWIATNTHRIPNAQFWCLQNNTNRPKRCRPLRILPQLLSARRKCLHSRSTHPGRCLHAVHHSIPQSIASNRDACPSSAYHSTVRAITKSKHKQLIQTETQSMSYVWASVTISNLVVHGRYSVEHPFPARALCGTPAGSAQSLLARNLSCLIGLNSKQWS